MQNPATADGQKLDRGMGLAGALSANILNMVGIGPFITIPLALAAMGGPQAMLGWILGAILCLCDGMVWAELGSALPRSGGPYHYLLQAFGPRSWGRHSKFSLSLAAAFDRPDLHRGRCRRVWTICEFSCAASPACPSGDDRDGGLSARTRHCFTAASAPSAWSPSLLRWRFWGHACGSSSAALRPFQQRHRVQLPVRRLFIFRARSGWALVRPPSSPSMIMAGTTMFA